MMSDADARGGAVAGPVTALAACDNRVTAQAPAGAGSTVHAKPVSSKPRFVWEDPLLLDLQLTPEERMVRETAHAYAQEKLLPRVTEAFRHERFLGPLSACRRTLGKNC